MQPHVTRNQADRRLLLRHHLLDARRTYHQLVRRSWRSQPLLKVVERAGASAGSSPRAAEAAIAASSSVSAASEAPLALRACEQQWQLEVEAGHHAELAPT